MSDPRFFTIVPNNIQQIANVSMAYDNAQEIEECAKRGDLIRAKIRSVHVSCGCWRFFFMKSSKEFCVGSTSFLHTMISTFLQCFPSHVFLFNNLLFCFCNSPSHRSTVTSARSWRKSWVRRPRKRRSTRREKNSTSKWPPWVSVCVLHYLSFLAICELEVHSVHVIFSWGISYE